MKNPIITRMPESRGTNLRFTNQPKNLHGRDVRHRWITQHCIPIVILSAGLDGNDNEYNPPHTFQLLFLRSRLQLYYEGVQMNIKLAKSMITNNKLNKEMYSAGMIPVCSYISFRCMQQSNNLFLTLHVRYNVHFM